MREVEPTTDEMALYNEVSGRISAGIRALIKAGSLMRCACLTSLSHVVFEAHWVSYVPMAIMSGAPLYCTIADATPPSSSC